jgi:hypothetical protein
MMVTGKSQNPIIASIDPSKASSWRPALSSNSPNAISSPDRISAIDKSAWKWYCAASGRFRRIHLLCSSRPSTNTFAAISSPTLVSPAGKLYANGDRPAMGAPPDPRGPLPGR